MKTLLAPEKEIEARPPEQPTPDAEALATETKRFRRGMTFSLLKYGAAIFTGFGYWFISARLLGAEIVGIVTLLTSILGIFRPISSLGEQFALVPQLNRHHHHHHKIDLTTAKLFWTVTGLSAGTTLVLSVVYVALAIVMLDQVYHRPELTWLLLLYSIGFYSVFNLSNIVAAPFMAFQETKYPAIAELASGIFRIAAISLCIFAFGVTPLAGITAQVVGFFVALAVLWFFLRKVMPYGPKSLWAEGSILPRLKEVYRFSLKSLPGTLSVSVLQHADRLMLGYFANVSLLGIYSLTYALFERVLMVGTTYENMVFSSAARAQANPDRTVLESLYRAALMNSFFYILPVLALMSGFSKQLLALFGEEFVQGWLALEILLLGIVFDNFSRITTGMIGGLNQPGLKAMIVAAGAIINLVGNLLLIPRLGIVGAGMANMLGYFFTAVFCLVWLISTREARPINRRLIGNLGIVFACNLALYGLVVLLQEYITLGIWQAGLLGAGLLGGYYLLGRKGLRLMTRHA